MTSLQEAADTGNRKMGPLLPHHITQLRRSAISDDVIRERGYQSVSRPTPGDARSRDQLRRAGISGKTWRDDARYPGLLIPAYRPTGEFMGFTYRPDNPGKDEKGRVRKYVMPAGRPSVIDVHPRNTAKMCDPAEPLWVTEGVKKSDALTSQGLCAAGLSGVYNWRGPDGANGNWEDIKISGRVCYVCFDADASTNPNVARAMGRFGRWLNSKGAKKVLYVVVPGEVNGIEVKGADDYLFAKGTVDGLIKAATTQPPEITDGVRNFTDSEMALDASIECLVEFCWNQAYGWMHWDGACWKEAPDALAIEHVRDWIQQSFIAANDAAGKATAAKDASAPARRAEAGQWERYLALGKITAVTTLCKGLLLRNALDFDQHPDLLNVANGVVDLRTGELRPHDPDLFMTKVAAVAYDPDAEHPDWTKALEALPAGTHDWYQVRMGQAATGYPPPDDVMVLQLGGGENGKTTLLIAMPAALGDYYLLVPDKALAVKPGDHSTELMPFRGARMALIEETPDGHVLDVQRLKRIVGQPQITARLCAKDNVTFNISHSLFLSTNYLPLVREIDHGTWRRLALLRFPWTFQKRPADVKTTHDRLGDLGLRDRIRDGRDGQHEAVLGWLVKGARTWYESSRVMPEMPESITTDTENWRGQSDLAGAWLDERTVLDTTKHIPAVEVLADFNRWLTERGHFVWGDQTLAARLGEHPAVASGRVVKKRILDGDTATTPSRLPNPFGAPPEGGLPAKYTAWVGFSFGAGLSLSDQKKTAVAA
jgi:putative DNA primase/helicase